MEHACPRREVLRRDLRNMHSIQDEQSACKWQDDSHSRAGRVLTNCFSGLDDRQALQEYIPTRSDVDAPQTAKKFFEHAVCHHGLPAMIISDRDPKFTSTFWKSFMKIMGIRQAMTTAGRAQADGATERQNRTLEDALRYQVSYLGQDWVDQLPTIEYAHQGLVQASTGLMPFEVDTCRNLRNPAVSVSLPKNDYVAEHRKEVIRMVHENLTKAQPHQKEYYDKRRSNVTFKEGNQVLLATRNLPSKHAQMLDKSERPKLVAYFNGPFKIVHAINDNAMRLNLPRSISGVHDVFNVDRLKHYHPNEAKFAPRPIPKATPIVIDESTGEEMYIVDKLLKKRQFNCK
ncbi:hypothetical protein AaE_015305 [Aphanomyces astaci]|uniref:Integrase catalytic domain-containing protein n=1 Tax=Aphanomyces astaci TaxID=112090 RepID=A0A6A4Z854_APHAT|nr:hypothetical protein AaE_015305 [Aphanomyces astaci]